MISFPVMALVIFAVIGVIFALWLRRVMEQRDERIAGAGQEIKPPEIQKDTSLIKKGTLGVKKNQKMALIIGGLVVFIIFASSLYEEFGESAGGSGFNFSILIPIWIVMIIAINAANKKKQQKLPEQHQKVLRAVAGFIIAIVIGIIVFSVYSQR